MKKPFTVFFFLLLVSLSSFSQSSTHKSNSQKSAVPIDFKNSYKEAEKLLTENNYWEALAIFNVLDSLQPNNANINFNIGFCYINSVSDKVKSIPYLEFASRKMSLRYTGNYNDTTAPIYSIYYLAAGYHIAYRFDEALDLFTQFKAYLTATDDEDDLLYDVDRRIEMCYNARKLERTPIFITIDNIGKTVNTKYPEYAPIISSDKSTLIFTSRRQGNTGGKDKDGKYFEDIYLTTKKTDESWRTPSKIGANINTPSHEAGISLAPDGKELFIYKDDNGDGNIYSSKYLNKQWQSPVKLNKFINTKYRETHACITGDGSTLYFTSDRPGGIGGLDIWKSTKQKNGDWGKPENLGEPVNSQLDEESPFILADGKTLYFSSQGHESMGGFDIFISTLSSDGFWSEPQNVGYPINTTEDDVFYVPTQDENEAYYSSAKDGGLGDQDIYLITIRKERKRTVALKGKIMDAVSYAKTYAHFEIYDNSKKEVIAFFDNDIKSGEFYVTLIPNRTYFIKVNAKNHKEKLDTVDISNDYKIDEIIKDYYLQPLSAEDTMITAKKTTETKNISFYAPSNDSTSLKPLMDSLLVAMQKKVFEEDTLQKSIKTQLQTKYINKEMTYNISDTIVAPDAVVKNTVVTNEVVVGEKIVLQVFYDYNKSMLKPESKTELIRLENLIKKSPSMKIEIAGYTDNKGSVKYNYKLSIARAKVIYSYLIKHGVNPKQLIYKGYGPKYPIATNTTPEGRQQNRRTEFKVLSK